MCFGCFHKIYIIFATIFQHSFIFINMDKAQFRLFGIVGKTEF
jgi:hypothetical protein